MNIILFGPPACGKGTQAKILASQGMIHLSTGDMLRAEVATGSDFGKEIESIISTGAYMPDEVVTKLIAARLDAAPDAAFIFDGYPRTATQAVSLDLLLSDRDQKIDMVINFIVDRENLLGRIHKRFASEGRSDDTPETYAKRLVKYDQDTAVLLPYYEEKGIVKNVDGMLDIETLSSVISILIGWHS